MATLWDAYENESLQDKDISDKTIKQNLVAQTKFWNAQQGYEKGKMQQFWNSILKCFNPEIDLAQTVVYEKQVKDPHSQSTKFIDAYITTTNVLIEQKSSHVALDRPEPQSDGVALTPFQQAERYDNWLPLEEKARYIVCSNNRTIEIHDRNKPLEPPTVIPFTPDGVSRNYYRLKFLLDKESTVTALETAVSKQAALLIGELYNDIIALYSEDEITPTLLHDLNVFCVRMVFCFYAEDSLVFSKKDMFGNFLQDFHHKRSAFRSMLKCLFAVLNTPYEQRDIEEKELNKFPYINGGLFDKQTLLPRFTESIAYSITQKISLGFDWSPINPAIFGAMFESTLSSDDRREGGMHYTTTDNIDKALAPLFLDGLRQKLDAAVKIADPMQKRDTLLALQDILASIRILDPACGSGNFLTYAYMELRRIENKILYELLTAGFTLPDDPIKVSLSQFYGFEINDFAVDVAKTALWISQNQMLHETQQILGTSLPELPLCNIETFHCVNSLRIKWEDYVKPQDLDYIVGNPPFVGARLMNAAQKEDIVNIFGNDWKNIGNMDYVTCWYKKAYDFIQQNPKIRCAFVSTNSICQGEQVANLWKPLFEGGLTIDFAYRTFRWESDSVGMAHVHCVIVGFSLQSTDVKRIYNPDGTSETAKNINAYLMDAPNVFIDSRNKPICNVPEMVFGNMPNDGGNLIIEENDYSDFVKQSPDAKQYIKQFVGADEFLNNKKRYCLWLKGVNPLNISKIPKIKERVQAVKKIRLASSRSGTQSKAETPTLFGEIRQPDSTYLLIPRHSSEKRKYIPIGFMDKDVIAGDSNLIIPNATLYEFGILTSIVHNAWMRVVAGRLESRYRYSKDIVYNNFPWPDGGREGVHTVSTIETAAQHILDIRENYISQGASLATLYGENLELLFSDLAAAHKALDEIVLGLYGLDKKATEPEIVARVFAMYEECLANNS